MRKLRLALAAPLLLTLGAGACDLTKQITAQKVMVATLFSTPAIDVSPAAFSAYDGGALPADAGFSSDAGALTLPPQTAAYVFLGQREGQSLDKAPTPVTGATVTVTPSGGAAATLKDEGSGNYAKTSLDDMSFTYQGGATYAFSATVAGETFVGEVTDSPPQERISKFHPPEAPNGYLSLAAGSPLTFTRTPAVAGKELNIGFVTVFPVSNDGQRGQPTYTNVPQTPLDFLKLIAVPVDWKQTTVTVPGSAFPNRDSNYVVLFNSVKSGGAKSNNLFIGSAILVGTAEVGLVRTQK